MDGTGPYDKVNPDSEMIRAQEIARLKRVKRKQQDAERKGSDQHAKEDKDTEFDPVDKIELSVNATSVNLTDIRYLAEHLLRQIRISEEGDNKSDMKTEAIPDANKAPEHMQPLYSKATQIYESHIDDGQNLSQTTEETSFEDRSGFLSLNKDTLKEIIDIIDHLKAIGQKNISVNPDQTYAERLGQLEKALNR